MDAGANLDQGADASDDVSDVESEDGITPMSVAAESGHLRPSAKSLGQLVLAELSGVPGRYCRQA